MHTETTPSSSWSEFATTFLSAEEERRNHEFLSRVAFQFLNCSESRTIAKRAAEASIPFLADLCIIALQDEKNELKQFHFAYRYEGDRPLLQNWMKNDSESLALFFEHHLPKAEVRALSSEEIAELPTAPGDYAAIARIGEEHDVRGCILFLRTKSSAAYDNSDLQLIRDFSELVAHSLLRTERTDFLKREVAARERLISIATHELNTPLTALKLQLDLLRKNIIAPSDDEKKTMAAMNTMDRTINSLSRSLGMLFNLSEIQSGQVVLQKDPSDLAAVVREIVQRMEPLLSRAKCTIETDLIEKCAGYFDRRRIEQAIVNLLANAAKYAPKSKVTVTLTSDGSTATLEVMDSGPGIPESQHQKIFEAFRRATDDTKVRGLGLGLFVARAVVRAHQGELKLMSQAGEGARFQLRLPLWEA